MLSPVTFAKTKVTGRRHVSELLLPGFKAPILLLRSARPNGLGMALFALVLLFCDRKGSSVLVVSSWLLIFLVKSWFVICLLSIVALVWTKECLIVFVKLWGASSRLILSLFFCFVGDFNCHYSEWLGSRITDAHVVAAFEFATVADCSQQVNGPTGLVVYWILYWQMCRIYVMWMFMVILEG